jgi:hypothetical protein
MEEEERDPPRRLIFRLLRVYHYQLDRHFGQPFKFLIKIISQISPAFRWAKLTRFSVQPNEPRINGEKQVHVA